MPKLLSPTGLTTPRNDAWGSGAFRASRGPKRKHKGFDFPCTVGQQVLSPIDGKVIRLARPYRNDDVLEGVLLQNGDLTIKMFYFRLDRSLLGQEVRQGDLLGYAQDISGRYRGMTPHVHLQIDEINPLLLLS